MHGDIDYLAPEVILQDDSLCDSRTDIYSLGKLAFRLLTGKPSCQVSRFYFAMIKLLTEPIPKLSSRDCKAPDWLEFLVYKATRPLPSERFQSITEIIKLIEDHFDLEARVTKAHVKLKPGYRKTNHVQ